MTQPSLWDAPPLAPDEPEPVVCGCGEPIRGGLARRTRGGTLMWGRGAYIDQLDASRITIVELGGSGAVLHQCRRRWPKGARTRLLSEPS